MQNDLMKNGEGVWEMKARGKVKGERKIKRREQGMTRRNVWLTFNENESFAAKCLQFPFCFVFFFSICSISKRIRREKVLLYDKIEMYNDVKHDGTIFNWRERYLWKSSRVFNSNEQDHLKREDNYKIFVFQKRVFFFH